ncbi:substrate-binding periplasmic protein [Shewanella xiamenensis]|uniref:ABC transporter substrate-binding protein n=1 Tax=Shewanella xiamenensis TaxID=332186 RepID=A0AAE4Q2L0_9GAMM|nr:MULTISPECIES: ABC transporter substrate-binding protein [Shewanella]MDV5391533.1 ABC transporter substrate-binding protein [Shewanella xiamenensis]PWH03161.1 ABC transporter substrate-binding protein [Shewanella xiamenensis]BDQ64912.1 ABC transporter substrate-binding protein [Shewanella xiamenensis]GLD76193.1 ABC transporter substrate-binding protein [Shewanella xiamenensis]
MLPTFSKHCYRLLFCVGLLVYAGGSFAVTEPVRLVTEAWPPMSFEQDGVPTGFGVELVNQLQARIGQQEKIEILPWARAYAIANSAPNILLFATSISDEREAHFDFIGPIATSKITLYAKAEDPISIKQLADVSAAGIVGVYRESVGAQLLQQQGVTSLLVASFPQQSAKQLLFSRVRFWCQADLAVKHILEDVGAKDSAIKPVYIIAEIHLYLAFSKGTPAETVQRWQVELEKLKESGEFAKVYQKWFGALQPPLENQIFWRKNNSASR